MVLLGFLVGFSSVFSSHKTISYAGITVNKNVLNVSLNK